MKEVINKYTGDLITRYQFLKLCVTNFYIMLTKMRFSSSFKQKNLKFKRDEFFIPHINIYYVTDPQQ